MAIGQRKARSLDLELNLIPFINILAMCICFLLMTAVWFQVTAVPVKQSHGTDGAAAGAGYDLEVLFTDTNQIEMKLLRNGRRYQRARLKGDDTKALIPQVETTLNKWFTAITPKKSPADFKAGSLITTAMVTPRHGVSYGDLVATMDVLRGKDIVNLGVVPVRRN